MDLTERIDRELAESSLTWWEWNVETNRVSFNDRKVTKLGYRPEDFAEAGYQAFTELIHPEDHQRAMKAMREYLSGDESIYRVDYRIRRADGSYTWYVDRGYAVEQDKHGRPRVIRGFVFDLGNELQDNVLNRRIVSLVRAALPQAGSSTCTVTVVCAGCKRLKIAQDEWIKITADLSTVYPEHLSHGICPTCISALYPEYAAS